MPIEDRLKKKARGGYYTTEPKLKWYELPLGTVVDQDKYNYEKEIWGDWYVEMNRKNGAYRVKDTSKDYKKKLQEWRAFQKNREEEKKRGIK